MARITQLLVCSGIHGDEGALQRLETLIQERHPDAVLFAGGVVNTADTTLGVHEIALQFTERFFQSLGRGGVFAAVIPGVYDLPLRHFLRLGTTAEVASVPVRLAHITPVVHGDLAICGIGGELTEHEDRAGDPLRYARASAEYYLRPLWQLNQPYKVLLLAVPPTGRLGGDEGNAIASDFIESYHPSLCVAAGPTAQRGSQHVASTLIVNPGQLIAGSAAWVDLAQPPDDQVEMLDVTE